MFNFKNIRNQFGDNPFASDLENVFIIETTKPYKQGQVLNHLGINYIVKRDVGVRKKILLVQDGLIAIPEEASYNSILNTRQVLNRHVQNEPVRVFEVPVTGVWGFSGYYDYVPKSAIIHFNSRGKDEIVFNNSTTSSMKFGFIYVDPLDSNKRVYTLSVGNGDVGILGTRAVDGRGVSPTSWSDQRYFFWDIFSFSISNSWIWVPGQRLSNDIDPDYGEGIVGDFKTNMWGSSMDIAFTGDWFDTSSPLPGSPDKIWLAEGTMKHIVNGANLPARRYVRRSVSPNPNRITTVTVESDYSRPKIADTRTNRVISYDVANRVVKTISDPNGGSYKYEATPLGNDEGCFLYDYSGDLTNPVKTQVNHYGPYVISLFRNSPNSSNLDVSWVKSNYEVGDILTITYPSEFIGQGFPIQKGEVTLVSTFTQLYGADIINGIELGNEVSEYQQAKTLPIENVWGWLPCTEDLAFVGVKGRITSLSTDSTTQRSLGGGILFSFNSSHIDFFRSLTFEITSIEVPKTFTSSDQTRQPMSTERRGSAGQNAGQLVFGHSFSMINSLPYDHPTIYSYGSETDLGDAFVGEVFQDGFTNRYWWEGDYIWHISTEDGVGQVMENTGSLSPDNSLYVKRFKLVLNNIKNRYDVYFDGWDKFSLGFPKSVTATSATEIGINDLTITAPLMK